MLIADILSEGLPQAGPLYHATDIMRAARILLADEIVAATDHYIWRSGHNETKLSEPGVSLTRSFRFAVDWRRFGAIFTLDGDLLRATSRLYHVDYYRDRREAEEFLIGPIKPLSRFLLAITIDDATRDYCIEHDKELIEGHKDYEDLLSHPLLKVMRFPSQAPYSNPRKPGAGMFD